MENRLSRVLNYIFAGCYLACMLLVFITNGNTLYGLQLELLFIFIGVLIFYRNIPRFSIVLFLFSFAVRIFACLVLPVEPVSDFKEMFEAARQVVQGDFSFHEDTYFLKWAYQTGFVLFEAFFLKIFNSIWTLKIINCFMGAGISVLIYKTVLLLWKDEKVAQIVSLIYSVFVFHVVHIVILTNSHGCAFFSFLGIYIFLKHMEENKIKWYALAGLCIGVGNMIRPEGIVFLAALAAFYVLKICGNLNKKLIFQNIKQLVVTVAAYFLVINIAAGLVQVSGINPNGLSNQDPLWKFVLGVNYESRGGYSDTDMDLIAQRQEENGGDRREAELSIIKERLTPIVQLADLFLCKIDNLWWSQSGIDWSVGAVYPKIQECLKKINVGQFWLMLVFSMITVIRIRKNMEKDKRILYFPLFILANFFVYLFIEVQARYVYINQIAVFIAAGGGVKYLRDKFIISNFSRRKNHQS